MLRGYSLILRHARQCILSVNSRRNSKRRDHSAPEIACGNCPFWRQSGTVALRRMTHLACGVASRLGILQTSGDFARRWYGGTFGMEVCFGRTARGIGVVVACVHKLAVFITGAIAWQSTLSTSPFVRGVWRLPVENRTSEPPPKFLRTGVRRARRDG